MPSAPPSAIALTRPLPPHPQNLAHADAIASCAEDLGCDLAVIQPLGSEAEDFIGIVSGCPLCATRALVLELGRRPDDERENGEAVDARIASDELAAGSGSGEECIVSDEVLAQGLGGHENSLVSASGNELYTDFLLDLADLS